MEQFYQTMLTYIHQRSYLEKTILAITKYVPYITFCLYPCLLIYLFIHKSPLLLATFFKPLGAFITVTIIRKIVNRPRPYEAMDIIPLKQHKSGESFPSRHAVSSMIIALVCFPISFPLGVVTTIIASIMCISRILAGVHYISDVVVAIMIALLFYLI